MVHKLFFFFLKSIFLASQIFSKFGPVLKIITFTKNNQFQALIQFADPTNAYYAKMVSTLLFCFLVLSLPKINWSLYITLVIACSLHFLLLVILTLLHKNNIGNPHCLRGQHSTINCKHECVDHIKILLILPSQRLGLSVVKGDGNYSCHKKPSPCQTNWTIFSEN